MSSEPKDGKKEGAEKAPSASPDEKRVDRPLRELAPDRLRRHPERQQRT